jgi:hypothetical protein
MAASSSAEMSGIEEKLLCLVGFGASAVASPDFFCIVTLTP